MQVEVAPDYQRNAPLTIAVLPFTDHGNANFVVDKIPLTVRRKRQRAIWAWTDAQRLRRSMLGYLSEREFEVLNPIAVDVVLKSHGITDEAKLSQIDPRTRPLARRRRRGLWRSPQSRSATSAVANGY